MLFYQIITIINALVAGAVVALCLFKRLFSRDDRSFTYLSLAVLLWAVPEALSTFFPGWDMVLLWRVSTLGTLAVPLAFYNYAVDLSGRKKKRIFLLKIFSYAAAALALLSFTPFIIRSVDCVPVASPGFALLAAYFLAVVTSGLMIVNKYYLGLPEPARAKTKLIFAASIVLFAGIASGVIFRCGFKPAASGAILAAAGVGSMYALSRYSISEIRLNFTRAGIFTVIYAFILGTPFYIGIVTNHWKLAVALMGVLASIGPFVYDLLGRKVKDIMLAQQKRYQKMLVQISQSMVQEHDLNRLVKYIVYAVKQSVRIEYAALFLNSPDDKAFVLKAVKNTGRLHPKFYFSYKHPLIMFLKEHKRPVTMDELPRSLDGFKEIDLGIRLIVPSFMEERLVCFLFLGEKLDKMPYTEDDLNIFLTLSGQVGLAVENCMYLHEFEIAQEKIFNADKLASLGGMADGVAHQIKNRLNQFSIAAGEQQYEIEEFMKTHKKIVESSPELKKTFDYLAEISSSVLENVKKTTSVIQGVLSFAHVEEKGSEYGEFPIADIIKPTLELLCVKHQINGFPLVVLPGYLEPVSGIKSQVMECIYNILDNSYEAIREKVDYHLKNKRGFNPMIMLKIIKKDKSSIIEISDNGVGIKEENLNKIFAPFFTTKSSYKTGSGVGMYVVKRMIEENHKGKVRVESEYMKGTKISLEIPKRAV